MMKSTPWQTMSLFAVTALTLCSCSMQDNLVEQENRLKAREQELEAKMNAKGKVVYAVKDVPEGAKITTDALEEREIEQSKIPQDAITSSSLAAGRTAKYGISTGQIVSQHDLASARNKIKSAEQKADSK